MVFRMAVRELWRGRFRLALLALVLALQVMTIGGTVVGTHSFDVARDEYYRTLHFADLEVKFVPASDQEMPPLDVLRKIPGVRAVTRRYVTHGTIEDKDAAPWPVVVVYLDPGPQDVNNIAVLKGSGLDPKDPSGAMIDASFAEVRHVGLGDTVVINPHRFATRFTVRGVGMSPEHLAPAVDPRFLLPTKGSLGIVYAPRAALDAVFVDRLYNNLLFEYAPGADEAAVQRKIAEALHALKLEELVPRRANMGHRLFDEIMRTPRVLTPILALVVGLLGAIVAYVLLMRIVGSQRREIGALLAIGFPHWHFIAAYLVVGLAPGMHGANATGRAFTGDHAGILLYETLHDFGFASAAASVSRDDGLELLDCRISNAVKCLPPDNRPMPAEVAQCRRFLAADLASLPDGAAIVALGRVAHEAVLRVLGSVGEPPLPRARRRGEPCSAAEFADRPGEGAPGPELEAMRPLLAIQADWSALPRPGTLLVETLQSREGFHLFVFPFAGRLVNEGLATLVAARWAREAPRTFSVATNEYGFELLGPEPLPVDAPTLRRLLAPANLLEDLLAAINVSELARRQFRGIARIAGLVDVGPPRRGKSTRQLQASTALVYDVLRQYDAGSLLLAQAEREVLESQLELAPLRAALERAAASELLLRQPRRLTPLSFPLWAERLQTQTVSTETWQERVERAARQLEAQLDD